MNFGNKTLPIAAVQGPQPRRWWLLTMATGAQCGVWNRTPTLELTSDKQNQAKYMDFCHIQLPIIAVQGPQPRRWWLHTLATGSQYGAWNQPPQLNWRRTNKLYSIHRFWLWPIAYRRCTRSPASTMVASDHGHWGPVWYLKWTTNAWIDVGQTKLASIHGFLS